MERHMNEREAKSVKQALIAARWIIENVGWRQGSFGNERTGFCAVGALGSVECSGSIYNNAVDKLLSVLPKNGTIPDWNDRPSRTKRQVVEAFTSAIKAA